MNMKELQEYQQIAARIREAMEARRISYGELAALTEIPKSALQRYATGTTGKIPLDRVVRIAGALQIPAARLMGWEETEAAESRRDGELLRLLMKLQPEELPMVISFILGLQAARQEDTREAKHPGKEET